MAADLAAVDQVTRTSGELDAVVAAHTRERRSADLDPVDARSDHAGEGARDDPGAARACRDVTVDFAVERCGADPVEFDEHVGQATDPGRSGHTAMGEPSACSQAPAIGAAAGYGNEYVPV